MRVIARTFASGVGLLVVCLAAGLAHAQPVPIASQFGTQTATQDPQKLQLPLRAPLTLVPSITISEEFNDNILLDNRNRQWDLITGITPAINFIWESRTHRLIAGYNFTAELFLRDSTRDNAFRGARAAIGLPHIVWGKVVYVAALVPFVGLVLIMRRRS